MCASVGPSKLQNKKRVTKRTNTCPNILFEKWLSEMLQSVPDDSNMKHVYGRALKSLRKHPLKLNSGKECIVIQNFGKKLCDILDKKLEDHLKHGGSKKDLHHTNTLSSDEEESRTSQKKKKLGSLSQSGTRKPRKEYVPAPRTGAYAILVTLHQITLDPAHKGFLTKAELIDKAQSMCDASFTRPSDPKSFYTAWSSMQTLREKKLVTTMGNPAKYSLTQDGIHLADKLVDVTLAGPSLNAEEDIGMSSDSELETEPPPPKRKRASKTTGSESRTHVPPPSDYNGRCALSSKLNYSSSDIEVIDDVTPSAFKQTVIPVSKLSDDLVIKLHGNSSSSDVLKKVPPSSQSNHFDSCVQPSKPLGSKMVFKPKKWTGLGILPMSQNSAVIPPSESSESRITNCVSQLDCAPSPSCEDWDSRNPVTLNSASDTDFAPSMPDIDQSPGQDVSSFKENVVRDQYPESDDSLPDVSDVVGLQGRWQTGANEVVSVSAKKPRFLYVYLNPEGKKTVSKDEAEVFFDEVDFFTGYCCLCVKMDLFTMGKRYRNLTERSNGIAKVFIDDRDCYDVSPCVNETEIVPIPPRTVSSQTSVQTTTTSISSTSSSNSSQPYTSRRPVLPLTTSDVSAIPSTSSSHSSQPSTSRRPVVRLTTSDISAIPSTSSSHSSQPSTSRRLVVPLTTSDVSASPSLIRVSSDSVLSKGSANGSQETVKSVDSAPVRPVFLEPGKFKIFLLVDTGETSGSLGRSDQKVLTLTEVKKQDIPHDIRRLSVGDYLWVARSTTNQADELVLPYVIERKRLDDLACSIKDGRYKEQKFRMGRSGIQNLIYLAEEYGSRQHLGLPEKSIIQAVINTQVIEGFQVRWTKSTAESVSYVKRMTSLLTKKYLTKTLASSSGAEAGGRSNNNLEILMTFEEFSKHCNKRKALSISETFGKQLMQLHGVSDKKAAAIIGRFPTPSSLFEAYDRCSSDKEREELLSGGKGNKTGISPQISKSLYMLFNRYSV